MENGPERILICMLKASQLVAPCYTAITSAEMGNDSIQYGILNHTEWFILSEVW